MWTILYLHRENVGLFVNTINLAASSWLNQITYDLESHLCLIKDEYFYFVLRNIPQSSS